MSREQDIQELCEQVLDITADFYDDPNGPYSKTCPLCGVEVRYGGDEKSPTMETIPHNLRCGYLIAKDLLTKQEKK